MVIIRKPNIFDNMLAMMEKYADNLEALVDERTDQLIEEKKKTGEFFYFIINSLFYIYTCIMCDILCNILVAHCAKHI